MFRGEGGGPPAGWEEGLGAGTRGGLQVPGAEDPGSFFPWDKGLKVPVEAADPGGMQEGNWRLLSLEPCAKDWSRLEDSLLRKGWSQGAPNLMTGTEKKTGHCNTGCHRFSAERGAQTRLRRPAGRSGRASWRR